LLPSTPSTQTTDLLVDRTEGQLGQRHRLRIWSDDVVRNVPLPARGSLVVGRGRESGIRLDSRSVSRRHAELVFEPGSARIVDLDSQNGTRVNGERVTSPRALVYEDVVTFGEVTSVFTREPAGAGAGASGETSDPIELGERVLQIGERDVVIADPAMLHAYTQLQRLARSELLVLILGETGTGKDLAAAALHVWSKRFDRPLVTINCAALPESLAESELFGYERGAFSGAMSAKPGLLESAAGGTVFLDEIGDLSIATQAKVLRAIETRRVTRLGSVRETAIDARIVAATHRDLLSDVNAGRFRQDLYYRLSVAMVRLPPLRARAREVPLLASHFLAGACRSLDRSVPSLTDAAMTMLTAHTWPGNVRELKNLMDFVAATVTDTQIDRRHLPPLLPGSTISTKSSSKEPPPPRSVQRGFLPLGEASRAFEREHIEAALTATGGNKTRAAKLLGVPLRTFMTKIRRLRETKG
jgi:DNA-binding NtrC family response regulator